MRPLVEHVGVLQRAFSLNLQKSSLLRRKPLPATSTSLARQPTFRRGLARHKAVLSQLDHRPARTSLRSTPTGDGAPPSPLSPAHHPHFTHASPGPQTGTELPHKTSSHTLVTPASTSITLRHPPPHRLGTEPTPQNHQSKSHPQKIQLTAHQRHPSGDGARPSVCRRPS